MKKRVFIIHGWGYTVVDNWYQWLKDKLEATGFEVSLTLMPNTEEPEIGAWVNYLSDLVGTPDENTYFIGHSIGCQTIMRYLQSQNNKVGGALFIAGWFMLNNLDEEELEIAKPWLETPIDFKKLKNASKNYSLVISDNDPFGGFEENQDAFKSFDCKIIVLPNAGHIEDRELPIALEEFLKITKNE